MYLLSAKVRVGKQSSGAILLFLPVSGLVSTLTLPTSLPVPAVVPTSTRGSALFLSFSPKLKISSGENDGLVAYTATAFAASRGEPPPIPIIKSALKQINSI